MAVAMDNFKARLLAAWEGDPPRIEVLAYPFPSAPHLPLSGGGCTNMSLEKFLAQLETDKKHQTGYYFAYVMNGCKEEADTYFLEGWEMYTSSQSCYEALVILYYSAVNPYATLLKYMGEEMASDYLQSTAQSLNTLVSTEFVKVL
ncbi:hypothetical protein [Cylindrospermopsis raciborskii]|uniref:hypothetical protein n=2 Tax=Cylindrospermopsis raciborskii TaxID=77022 RepID=UPI0022C3E534|nr:hypothetical protein [Cylindrospermopsis raciborskii]MCZ2206430.1 hypothetical protein [Cylindrospermopsis raciborskii PAMP2011]